MSEFTRGFCVSVCLHGMIQDIIGKEKYLKAVELTWINASPWIWFMGILLFLLPWDKLVSGGKGKR